MTWVLVVMMFYPPPAHGPYGPVMFAHSQPSFQQCLVAKQKEESKPWPPGITKLEAWCVPLK